jgi:chemotaxis protein CheY-P-specific phosphatase CheC
MPRIMDLPGWPPIPGGAHKPGDFFPTSTDQVTIETVLRISEGNVMFMCRFGDRSVGYHFFVADENTAKKVAAVLSGNIGETLLSIGMMELPPDAE